MDVFDIYIARHTWRGCSDRRWWLIVDFPPNGLVGCFPIATECYDGRCFPVHASHPDFPATGLSHSSNIHDEKIIELEGNSILKFKGRLQGQLLAEFRRYSGI